MASCRRRAENEVLPLALPLAAQQYLYAADTNPDSKEAGAASDLFLVAELSRRPVPPPCPHWRLRPSCSSIAVGRCYHQTVDALLRPLEYPGRPPTVGLTARHIWSRLPALMLPSLSCTEQRNTFLSVFRNRCRPSPPLSTPCAGFYSIAATATTNNPTQPTDISPFSTVDVILSSATSLERSPPIYFSLPERVSRPDDDLNIFSCVERFAHTAWARE